MQLLASLKALSDENRLKLLRMLCTSDLCVGALASQLGLSKPAVSQHLGIMRKAGLVRGEKRGYWTHYAVNKTVLSQVAAALLALSEAEQPRTNICWRISDMTAGKPLSKEVEMCHACCQQPDQLKDKPEHCTPEQIRMCHGEGKDHPCQKNVGTGERQA